MQGSYPNQGWVPCGYPVDHTYAWHQVNRFPNVSSFYYFPLQPQLCDDSGSGGATIASTPCTSSKVVGSSHYEESGSHFLALRKNEGQCLQSTHSKVEPETSECHDAVPMDISPCSSPARIVSNEKISPRPTSSPAESRALHPARNVKHVLEKVAFRLADPEKMPSSALDVLKKSAEIFAPMGLNGKEKNSHCRRKQVSSSPEWQERRRLNVHSPDRNGLSSQGGKDEGNLGPSRNAKGQGFQDFSRLPPNWLTPLPVKRLSGKDVNGKFVRKEDCKALMVPESNVVDGSTAKLVNKNIITPLENMKSGKSSVNTIGPLPTRLQSHLGHKMPSEKVASHSRVPHIHPTSTRVNRVAEKDTKVASDNKVNVLGTKPKNEKNGGKRNVNITISAVKPGTDMTSVEASVSLPQLHDLGSAVSAVYTPEHSEPDVDLSGGRLRSNTISSTELSESATEYMVPDDISCTLLSSSDIAFSSSLGGCIMEKSELMLELQKLLDGFVWGE
ncbi:unnamed protein product [Ixodes hexagonus]